MKLISPILTLEYIQCPVCGEGRTWVDHLKPGFVSRWSCQAEGDRHQFDIEVDSLGNIWTEPTGIVYRRTKVTLQRDDITLILDTHNCSEDYEDYEGLAYLYNEGTCPTNYMDEVAEIILDGDPDPHGIFEFVSAEDWKKEDE